MLSLIFSFYAFMSLLCHITIGINVKGIWVNALLLVFYPAEKPKMKKGFFARLFECIKRWIKRLLSFS